MDIIKADSLVSKAKDLKIEGRNAVLLISFIGIIWLANKAMDKGYGMSFSFSEKNGVGLNLNPSNKSK